MTRNKSRLKEERKRKHKKLFRVIMEIVFMTLGVLCAIMPYPFPLLVPIVIGTTRIISRAVESEKEPPATQPIVYCNGVHESAPRKSKSERKTSPNAKGRAALMPQTGTRKRAATETLSAKTATERATVPAVDSSELKYTRKSKRNEPNERLI